MNIQQTIETAQRAERAGNWDIALDLYGRAVNEVRAIEDKIKLAELLRWIGRVHRLRGDLEAAEQSYRESLAVAKSSGDAEQVASGLNVLAMVRQAYGHVDEAEALYIQARELAAANGHERLTAMIEQNFATLANIRGETDVALASFASALERYQRVGDDWACAYARNNIGMAHTARGDWAQAENVFVLALENAARTGDAEMRGTLELNLADMHLKAGDLENAREHCATAFSIFSRLQSKTSLAETYKLFASIYKAAGKPQLAETHLSVIVELARACEDRLLEAEIEHERALLHVAEGRSREALISLNVAHEIFLAFKASRQILDIDKRLDRIEDTFLEVVRAWGESIESKDRYTLGHCSRVADYACLLAEAVGIKGRDLNWMRMGAFLHDVGKTGVPSEVLNKPGKLTDEEFDQMKKHTVLGDAIISETPFPWDIRPIVRNHHERWDGTGYPDRLKGDEIPFTARILCVADIYDALTTTRSYRGAMSQEKALQIMTEESGRTLDPDLFAVFKELIVKFEPQLAEALPEAAV